LVLSQIQPLAPAGVDPPIWRAAAGAEPLREGIQITKVPKRPSMRDGLPIPIGVVPTMRFGVNLSHARWRKGGSAGPFRLALTLVADPPDAAPNLQVVELRDVG
jgi:hypothetical protein